MSERGLSMGQIGSNRQLFQAYQSWQNKKNGDGELIDFFSSCVESKLMPQLVQLPWDPSEEEGLVNYLLNTSSAKSAKLQAILCLLLKGKIDQAQKYKEHCVSVDDDLFQSGMLISAIIDSYTKHFPQAPEKQPIKELTTPHSEKSNRQELQTPFNDTSMLNESVRRRRSKKNRDSMPTHPMQLRASSKKKSFSLH